MEAKKSLTHRELVEAAYKWILKSGGCGVAFKELNSLACNGEYPDAIGFSGWGRSVLVECKTSRADFHADKKKFFRANPQEGMGTMRYYCCPTGLLKVEDMPEGWGLLYVNERGRCTRVHRPTKPNPNYEGHVVDYTHEKNMKAEHGLMYSALRRLHIKGHIDSIYDKDYQGIMNMAKEVSD